tara:strand:- start:164 stop:418 length:255 start_codon:yes stop_codon:yes gene_type:complete
MKKQRILQILMIISILIILSIAVYQFSNTPIDCYESTETDSDTGELIPTGGCSPNYYITTANFILPFLIWLVIFVLLFILYKKN